MKTSKYIPLELETRPTLDTATAAFHLCRKAQTLRSWSSQGEGPIRPLRIYGRLHWCTNDIRRLVGSPIHYSTAAIDKKHHQITGADITHGDHLAGGSNHGN